MGSKTIIIKAVKPKYKEEIYQNWNILEIPEIKKESKSSKWIRIEIQDMKKDSKTVIGTDRKDSSEKDKKQ